MALYIGSTPVATGGSGGSSMTTTEDEIHVRDFLAGGDEFDGGSDVAYAVQAAVDEAIGPGNKTSVRRSSLAEVVLPAGTLPVSVPIRVESVGFFKMRGRGGSTKIVPGADDMECLLDLNGTAHSQFSDFRMTGASTYSVERAVWMRWNGVASNSTWNDLSGITVEALRYGKAFEIGDTAAQGVDVSMLNMIGCNAYGQGQTDPDFWQVGFQFGEGLGANNLVHTAIGCRASGHKFNVRNDNSQISWTGGLVQGGGVDFYHGGQGYMAVMGTRSEDSGRLFDSGGPAGFPQHVTFDDVVWAANEMNIDDIVARCRSGGVYKFRNCRFYIAPTGRHPKFAGDGSGFQLIEIDGVSATTAVGDLIASVSSNGQSKIRSYVQFDVSGNTIALTVN
jgi:hypothetical protein